MQQAGDPGAEDRSYQDLVLQREGNLVWLRLNRPQALNAIRQHTKQELMQALASASADHDLRVLAFSGTGRAFCAGADLKELSEERAREVSFRDRLARIEFTHEIVRALRKTRLVTVAAINGLAVGGGLALALACDVIVAGDDAYLAFSFGKHGLVPDAAMIRTLEEAVGRRRARYLALVAERVSAEQALSEGLVDEVVRPNELEQRVRALAERLAGWPGDALWATKRMYAAAEDRDLLLEAVVQAEALGASRAGYSSALRHETDRDYGRSAG